MSKNIKKIEFVLENLEIVTFKPEELGELHRGKITECVNRVACNSIAKSKVADDIAIEIFKKAQFQKSPMEGIKKKDYFKRIIKFPDITHINLIYSDDTEDYLSVIWEEDEKNDDINLLQKSMLSDLGNLYIIITSDKTKDVKDYFDMEEINDKDNMEFKEDMYSDWK